MAITLPIGIRIAAGLIGSTIDRVGKLPQELPTLGVSLAGQAVRTSFRIRQELAELATRGDELLAGLTGRAEEKPEWATFDEDEDEDLPDEESPVTVPAPERPVAQNSGGDPFSASTSAAPTRSRATKAPAGTSPTTAAAGKAVPVPTNRIRPGRPAKAEVRLPDEALPDEALPDDVPTVISAPKVARVPTRSRTASVRREPTATLGVPGTATGTSAVAGNHLLSVAELKETLQDLDIAAVRRLLATEEAGPNRAAYLTLLSNRLTTLDHENGQTSSR